MTYHEDPNEFSGYTWILLTFTLFQWNWMGLYLSYVLKFIKCILKN